MDCVMTMCVNSINPFLTGTRTALAENVITLLRRSAMWDDVAGREELGLSLRPHFVCCLVPTCNFDMHVMSKEGCGRVVCVRFLSAFEAEHEPIANDSMMGNVDDTMCWSLFGVN